MIYIQALGTDKVANQRSYDIIKKLIRWEKEIFIASSKSINYLPEGAKPNEVIIVDQDDIKQIIEKIDKLNFNEEIVINVTTGTKAMIIGLVYLAIKNKGKIIYIGGEREKEKVITGSEKIYEYDFR